MSEVKRYSCTVLVDASTGFNVEASDPEEAAEKAKMLAAESGATSICHQCSANLDIGDFCGVMVYDEDLDEQVLDTTHGAGQIARLIADYDALAAQRDEGLAREAKLKDACAKEFADVEMLSNKVKVLEQHLAEAEKLFRDIQPGTHPHHEIGKRVDAFLASPGCADGEKAE